MDMRDLIGPSKTAKLLSCSPRTCLNMHYRGELIAHNTGTETEPRWKWLVADVLAFRAKWFSPARAEGRSVASRV